MSHVTLCITTIPQQCCTDSTHCAAHNSSQNQSQSQNRSVYETHRLRFLPLVCCLDLRHMHSTFSIWEGKDKFDGDVSRDSGERKSQALKIIQCSNSILLRPSVLCIYFYCESSISKSRIRDPGSCNLMYETQYLGIKGLRSTVSTGHDAPIVSTAMVSIGWNKVGLI